jgi:hypothetical protein
MGATKGSAARWFQLVSKFGHLRGGPGGNTHGGGADHGRGCGHGGDRNNRGRHQPNQHVNADCPTS